MNHDQGLDDLQENRGLPSALNKRKPDPIQNPTQGKGSDFSDRGASDPAIGIPVKGRPNQILAGIPVFRFKQTSENPSAPQN